MIEPVQSEQAQQRPHFIRLERGAAAGNSLIERRQRIAHAALTDLRQNGESVGVGNNAFLLTDPAHARHQLGEIHAAERELLAAGGDGRRDLMGFRGAEDKDGPFGRLFQRFQQRVEGLVGDLMRFVDDENLVAVPRRAKTDALAQLAHLIDTAVGGGVDFNNVHRATGRDLQATRTDAARGGRWPINAVQTARHDASDGGFPGPALPAENVAVGDPALVNRVIQRGLDVCLTHQLRKRLGSVFPRDDLISRF